MGDRGVYNIPAGDQLLRCYYCNARSLKNKLAELYDILYNGFYNVICISESWLSDIVPDGLLDPHSKYFIYRKDRYDGYGGVCIFVSSSIDSSLIINDDTYNEVELIGCNITISSFCISVFCFYCPPDISLDNFKHSLKGSSVLMSTLNCLVFGDYNLPKIEWVRNHVNFSSDPKALEFEQFCLDMGLEQINFFPTRKNAVLDLVLVNDELIVSKLHRGMPIDSSDHASLSVALVLPSHDNITEASIDSLYYFDWPSTNWVAYADYINDIDWQTFFALCKNSNECWYAFKNILDRGNILFVPELRSRIDSRGNRRSILPSRLLKNLEIKKNKLWKIAVKYPTTINRNNYKMIVIKIRNVKKNNAADWEKKIVESKNLGTLYKHINSRLTHKIGIAPLFNNEGNIVKCDLGKAELLNSHFVKVGKADDGTSPTLNTPCPGTTGINYIAFDTGHIFTLINKLKPNSSSGPDGIPAVLLKGLSHHLSRPLSIMFNLIFKFKHLPSEWKNAVVKPLFKKGCSSEAGNYRPISLTCILCKIFESVVKYNLVNYLTVNHFISKHQHGFLSKHSTTTNLLECINDWTKSMEAGAPVKVLYFDFAKAFDVVSVPKLMYKLKNYGIGGLLLSCIESFLTGRFQKVKVGNCYSSYLPVVSGVPQGSVLGPFLFLLYINDLPNVLTTDCTAKLFADDLKTYSKNDYCSNPNSVQVALNEIVNWSNTWQLQLAVPKCGSLILNINRHFNDVHNILLQGELFLELTSVTDLGVIIDSKLKFSEHITGMISKAKKRIFLIFKSFFSRDIVLLTFAFKVYVLPILDYCSTIWNPSNMYDIDRIENVQRYYTKRLKGLWDISYRERLVICSLTSLELRRLRADLILCYKIIHKLVDLNFDDFFKFDSNIRTRGHNFKLCLPKLKTYCRLNFFSVRVCPVWNSLPSSAVNSSSLNIFKTELSKINLQKFLNRFHD